MKHHQSNRSIAIYISCSTTTAKEVKVRYLAYMRNKVLFFLLQVTTESEYSKGASSHTSVEAGLQKKNSLKKILEVLFLSSLAMNLDVLLLTRVDVEHSKAKITNTASPPLSAASAASNADLKPIKVFV